MGENWRKDNTEKKNGKEIIKRVPPRIIADDLKQVVKFAVIGDTASDLEKAPLVFYNPDTGLYSNSNRNKKVVSFRSPTTYFKQR